MKLAYFIKRESLADDPKLAQMLDALSAQGHVLYALRAASELQEGTQALLSLGGDGTFLSAAEIAVRADLPILGVNFGRLGFLAGISPEELPLALAKGDLLQDSRALLEVQTSLPLPEGFWPCALNEMSVARSSASMLGVDVEVDGAKLPTYWADGLLVATSSGSTAYSLSVGGPICTPDTPVLIVAPVSPHNLNIRPLVVSQAAQIRLSLRSRSPQVAFSADNRTCSLPCECSFMIKTSPRRLQRLSSGKDNFIEALRTRLLWGQDLRNNSEFYVR